MFARLLAALRARKAAPAEAPAPAAVAPDGQSSAPRPPSEERRPETPPPTGETAELAALIERLRAEDPGFRVFGSAGHRYRLGWPLAAAELEAFEAEHGVRLPEAYRDFVATVGNGGAGPYHGVEPLYAEGDLSRPFPHVADPEDGGEDEAETPGTILLCHYGCGLYFHLVVNGPAHGSVWYYERGFARVADGFAEWYRGWAEQALRRLAGERAAQGLRVGMTRAEVAAAVPGEWKESAGGDPGTRYFQARDVPVQLKLDDRDIVVSAEPWHAL